MTQILDIFLPYQKNFFLNQKKRKIWLSSRQVGKSFTISGILTFKALSKKNGLSLCISTGSRAASEIIRKCVQFAEAVKKLSGGLIDYTASFDQIKFSNGSRVLSLPSSTDGSSLRGWTANCVCIDEAAYVWHLDEIMQALNPTLSRDPEAELILTTTPAGKNGPFYELYSNAINSETWYVQNTTIEDAIKDGLKTDLDSLHSLCPDTIVFNQEFMCQFSDQTNSLLDVSLIQTFDENEDKNVQYFMGVDFGRTHDATGIIVLKRDKTGKIYLVDAIKLNNVEYQKQFNIIRETFLKYRPKCCFCDAGGLGGPLAEELNRQVSALIKGIQFTAQNKAEMYEYLRKVVFDRQFFVQSGFAKQIKQELQMVRQIISESGKTTYSADRSSDSHADLISALILALHAERNNKQSSAMPTSASLFSAFGSRLSRL